MLIGITGGIGSGKSTIAAALQQRGYAVLYTDQEAKRLIVHDLAVRKQIEHLFGSDIFNGDTYLTHKVAAQVFTNPTLLQQLNTIVHPAVKQAVQQWYETQRAAVCFVECAILYEARLDNLCDAVIEVTAPEHVRIARTIARDHSTEAQVRARIHAQKNIQHTTADTLIINNDSVLPIAELIQQIEFFIHKFA